MYMYITYKRLYMNHSIYLTIVVLNYTKQRTSHGFENLANESIRRWTIWTSRNEERNLETRDVALVSLNFAMKPLFLKGVR